MKKCGIYGHKKDFFSYIIVSGDGMQFVFEYWIQVAFGVLISTSLYLLKKIKKYFFLLEQLKKSVLTLLRIELLDNYEYYRKKNGMRVEEKERIHSLYQEYSKLGEVGIMEELMDKLEDIPVISCKEED